MFSNFADKLWTYWRCACEFLIELELILTELRLFKLRYFWELLCPVGYVVCIINFFDRFQWMFLKHCRHSVNILEMCMWVFDGARINFDRITAF